MYRNITLKCLSEIGALDIVQDYNQKFVLMFEAVMETINRMIPPQTSECPVYLVFRRNRPKYAVIRGTHILLLSPFSRIDFKEAYDVAEDEEQQLIKNLAIFLTNFFTSHLKLLETPQTEGLLLNAHMYLIKISNVDDREIFKICLEYWQKVSGIAESVAWRLG